MNGNDNSGVNTVLIVIVLVVVVGGLVWFLNVRGANPAPADNGGINVDVKLPENTSNGGNTGGTGGSANGQ